MELPSREQVPLYGTSLRQAVAGERELLQLDELMDQLDVTALQARYQRVGHPAYPVRVMLKAILYGLLRGVQASRMLEEACRLHLAYLFLTHGMKPDHQAFCRFRRRHQEDLPDLFSQTVVLCMEAGLATLGEVAVDGTKIRANRSPETLRRLRRHWQEQLAAAEDADVAAGLVPEAEESRFMGQRPEPAYNAQVAVDGDHQVVVGMDLVTAPVDHGQLAPMVKQVVENTGQVPANVLADGGYWRQECVEEVGALGAAVHMPVPSNMGGSAEFVWVAAEGAYRCPAGHWLRPYRVRRGRQTYRTSCCRGCPHAPACGIRGGQKEISVVRPGGQTSELRARMATIAGQATYARRKQIVEPVFGWWKTNHHFTRFLLRGRRGAKAQLALLCIMHNLVRLVRASGGQNGRPHGSSPEPAPVATLLSIAVGLWTALATRTEVVLPASARIPAGC